MKSILFSILLLTCMPPIFSAIQAQEKLVDSLKQVLAKSKDDTSKVLAMVKIAYELSTTDSDQATLYANQAKMLSEKINFPKGKALGYSALATIVAFYKNFVRSYELHDTAIKIFLEANLLDHAANEYLSSTSDAFQEDNAVKGLASLLEALKLFEKTENQSGLTQTYLMMGTINNDEKDYETSLKNRLIALKFAEKNADTAWLTLIHNMLGENYFNLGDFQNALMHDSISLALGPKNEGLNEANIYNNIAAIYEAKGRIAASKGKKDSADKYFHKALENHEKALELVNQETVKAFEEPIHYYNLILLGRLYVQMHNLAEAKQVLDSAVSYFQNGNDAELAEGYLGLAELDSTRKDYKSAYENYKLYITARDKYYNEQKAGSLQKLRSQYDNDKQQALAKIEQESKDRSARRTRNLQYIIIGAILLLAGFLYIGIRQKQKANHRIEKAYSDLKSMQAQLIHSEKMASLGELTAGIAHEIQNPLNFVNNFSDVNIELLDELEKELSNGNSAAAFDLAKDVKANESKISHHGKRADSIVKGMLQHSRSSTGQKASADINQLVDEYVRLSYHGMRAREKTFNAAIITDYDPALGNADVVPQDIGRVILNLMSNAFHSVMEKANQENQQPGFEPCVSVKTVRVKNQFEIHIRDNGKGIPANTLAKIFQPFFTTKPTGQGTGLGLSLSYDIIKAHQGEIKVESDEEDFAEFLITIPIHP